MAERIANFEDIPEELPAMFDGLLTSERVQGIPERFTSDKVERETLQLINRLLLNLNAVRKDLQLLKLDNLLTVDDYKGLVVVSNDEFVILNGLLASSPSVLARLDALEAP